MVQLNIHPFPPHLPLPNHNIILYPTHCIFNACLDRYARKHFAGIDLAMTKEVQRAMALLAFKADTTCVPYKVN